MGERIIIVGGGGREHALVWELREADVYACARNRNPGIERLADGYRILDENDPDAVREYATDVGATLAVVGPEAPLDAGVVDALTDAGIYTFGPKQSQAKLETDKYYQRQFMQRHDIAQHPESEVFTDSEAACEYIDHSDEPLVVKPAGHAAGKAVKIVGEELSKAEAKTYVRQCDDEKFVLEERLDGEEFSIQCLVEGDELRPLPPSVDHKRVYEGDEGPNTGGMGTYTDSTFGLPFVTEREYEQAMDALEETLDALDEYRGVLCGQFLVTDDGISLFDYNVRFGDPEAINALAVLENDLLDVLETARDEGTIPSLHFEKKATVCKYAAPPGYPTNPDDGRSIDLRGSGSAVADDARLYYGRVEHRNGTLYTTTSRSLCVVGVGETIPSAEEKVERLYDRLAVDELHVRHDIGTEELVQRHVTTVEQLQK